MPGSTTSDFCFVVADDFFDLLAFFAGAVEGFKSCSALKGWD